MAQRLVAAVKSARCRLSAFTQLPSVPSLIVRSRATAAIGLPVSQTRRTAQPRRSASTFLRASVIALSPLKPMCRGHEGKPNAAQVVALFMN